MLTKFIAVLQNARLEMTAKEIADALWLAVKMDEIQRDEYVDPSLTVLQRHEGVAAEDYHLGDEQMPMPRISSLQQAPFAADISTKMQLSGERSDGENSLFRIPAVSALPHALAIARALRPFMRRFPSKTMFVFNEHATAQRIAETQNSIWSPVLEPLLTRWFDIALVIDEGVSMMLWMQTIVELRSLLEHHGAFRDVRLWRLATNDRESVQIYAGMGSVRKQNRAHNPKELIDPSGQRLILVVTDCVSAAWHSGKVQQVLDVWGNKNLVTLVQMLPRRLWHQTALNAATQLQVSSSSQHISNIQLKTHKVLQRLDEPVETEQRIAFPVVTLEHRTLLALAYMITGMESTWVTGITFEKEREDIVNQVPKEQEEQHLSSVKRVQLFRANASPTSHKLAGLLAATPIPISSHLIQVLQYTMLREANSVHVAEVMLGGLLEEVRRDEEMHVSAPVEYDFISGVRDLLLNAVPMPDAYQVLRETSTFVREHHDQRLDFIALTVESNASKQAIITTKESHTLAQITATVLRRLGGDFASFAEKLEQQIRKYETASVNNPGEAGPNKRETSQKTAKTVARRTDDATFPEQQRQASEKNRATESRREQATPGKVDIGEIASWLELKKSMAHAPILVLGSRAGSLFRSQNFYDVLERYSYRNFHGLAANEQFGECYNVLKQVQFYEGELHSLLRSSMRDSIPTEADIFLAELIKQGFFQEIISTNIDDVLEQALVQVGLREANDFELLWPPLERPHLERRLTYRITKIFGDFASRVYDVLRQQFLLQSNQGLINLVEHILAKDVLMVGVDPIWDEELLRVLPASKSTLWLVGEEGLVNHPLLSEHAIDRPIMYLTENEDVYENFLQALKQSFSQESGILTSEAIPYLSKEDAEREVRKGPMMQTDGMHIARVLMRKAAEDAQSSTVLFLGSRAGALFRSQKLYETCKLFSFRDFFSMSQIEQFTECYRVLYQNNLTQNDLSVILHDSLDDFSITDTDIQLAELIKQGMFGAIVTTNIDDALERACKSITMRENQDFQVLLPQQEEAGDPGNYTQKTPCLLVKLFGDFAIREYNINRRDVYLGKYENFSETLSSLLSRDILFIGYDPLWDQAIDGLIPEEGQNLWFVNEELYEDCQVFRLLQRRNGRYIVGEKGSYELFIQDLYRRIPLRNAQEHLPENR